MNQTLTRDELKALTRGQIVDVDLGPKIGAKKENQVFVGTELGGQRRCVIVQADAFNENWSTLIVVPILGLEGKAPGGGDRAVRVTEVLIPKGTAGQTKNGAAQANQIRTIDRYKRVVRILGTVPPEVMAEIEKKIRLVLGMVDLTP
jgi:mRNA-degrading endonuclease toxin of MazEF toxin-antitoxin module